MRHILGLLIFSFTGCAAAAKQEKASPNPITTISPSPAPARALPNLTETDEFPDLKVSPLEPKIDSDKFKKEIGSGYIYPYSEPAESGVELTEAQATERAKAWILLYFGDPDPNTTLIPRSRDEAQAATKKKSHIIHFRQFCRGIETDAFALVYFTNDIVTNAVIRLLKFEEIEKNKQKLIARDDAANSIRYYFRGRKLKKEQLEDLTRELHIKYVFSRMHMQLTGKENVFAPSWVGSEASLIVDGKTGFPRRND